MKGRKPAPLWEPPPAAQYDLKLAALRAGQPGATHRHPSMQRWIRENYRERFVPEAVLVEMGLALTEAEEGSMVGMPGWRPRNRDAKRR